MKKILLLVALFALFSISSSFAASLSEDTLFPPDDALSYSSATTTPKTGQPQSGNFDGFTPPDKRSPGAQQQMFPGQEFSNSQQRPESSFQQQQRYKARDAYGQQPQDSDEQQQDFDAQQQDLDALQQDLDAQQQDLEVQRQDLDVLRQDADVQRQEVTRQRPDTDQRLQKGLESQRQNQDVQQRETEGRPSDGTAKLTPGTSAKGKSVAATKKSAKRTRLKSAEPIELSAIERSMAENPVTAEKSRPQPYGVGQLTQFGYSFFKPESVGFASQTDVPVGPDYLIGAGDRLVVTVWGGIDGTFNLEVNRSGEVVLPKVGSVKVAGQSFGQLPALLKGTLSRVYKNFNLNVTMGKLRLIKVYVVGEVTAPGDYDVNSLSTLIGALSAAGGPTKNGSLRNIQIKRGGQTVETVDLYDFFLKGDKGKDIRLQPGDTVLVPVVGPVAGIAGNVRRPGIYELKGEHSLKELLALADGINPSGYLQRVLLYRVQAHDKKVVTDFNLDVNGDKKLDEIAGGIAIQDLDLVKVLPIDKVLRGYVRLTGHVLRPGDYALKPGMKVSSLLAGDNLLPEYYAGAGQIIRLCPPDMHPEVVFFDVSRALKGEAGFDLELKEFDRVKIFTRREMQELPIVKVSGEVQRPGQVRFMENMTVRDLLMQAGNVKLTAYLKNAEITRLKRSGDAVTSYSITVDLGKALQGGVENIKLEPFDELNVRRIPNWAESTERYVKLKGEFVFPGIYPIYKGERLSSVIERAGGFTDRAYLEGSKFTRKQARELQQQRMDEAIAKAQEDVISLQAKMAQTAASPEEVASSKATLEGLMQGLEVLKTKKAEGRMLVEISSLSSLKGGIYDLELQGGDQLVIPSDPGGVNVIGNVYNQNTVVTQKDQSVEWYLNQVGGATGEADLGEVYVVKVDGSVVSQKNSSKFLFYNSFWGKKLESGDTIIVPRQYEKTPWLRDIKDVAMIIGNIAVTAGVLVAAGLKF
jgi:protein involved in polysaccharide export with SLBB domain